MNAFRCPHCAGEIVFDIQKQSMRCDYCDSEISRKDYQKYLDEHQLYITNELVCPQCGAAILNCDDTISTFCSYCGSPVTFQRRIIEESKPDQIVPFALTKEEALEKYRQRLKDAGFAPKWLYEGGEDTMLGLYIPYHVYQGSVSSHVNTTGEERTVHGNYTTVQEYDVEFDLTAHYDGTRFDASEAFPDFMSESVDTFHDDEAKPFETSFLAGFYADGGNVGEEAYDGLAKTLIANDLCSTEFSYNDVTIKPASMEPEVSLTHKKVLFPVWLNTHRRKDRLCYSAINGQTGTVASEIPIDAGRYLKFSLIAAALIASLLNLFLTIRPAPFLAVSEVILFIFGICLRKLAGNVYLREHHADDIGTIGTEEFYKAASISGAASSKRGSVGRSNWSFSVPARVRIKSWWKTLLGLVVFAVVMLSKTAIDAVYYGAAAFNILLALISALNLIKQQNLLASRDIPIFTMKRGGRENV